MLITVRERQGKVLIGPQSSKKRAKAPERGHPSLKLVPTKLRGKRKRVESCVSSVPPTRH
jgi:hypothetical protein